MIDQITSLYNQFLSLFPPEFHFWVSLVLFLMLVFWLLSLIKKNIIWLILLIILLPVSIPLLKQIFSGILSFLRFLLGKTGV